jgi:hypothetical protein
VIVMYVYGNANRTIFSRLNNDPGNDIYIGVAM